MQAVANPGTGQSSPAPATPAQTTPEPNTDFLFGWGELPVAQARPGGGMTHGTPVTLAPPRALPLAEIAAAKTPFERDRAAILSLAGDYKTSFHFMETLGLTQDFKLARPYHSWATEQVRVIEDTGRFISLQHMLVMYFRQPDGTVAGPMVMKHWRQDWTFEDTDLHVYNGDDIWVRRKLAAGEAAGTWSQAVSQVDDSPRYEAYGKWEHRGNLSQWTGSRELRPLPRREHTTRKDYTVMEGEHRIILTSAGWLHQQENRKRVAGPAAGEPRYIAEELGLDRYERITAPSLAAGDEYWRNTAAYWAVVRRVFRELQARHDRLVLHDRIGQQALFEPLFAEADAYNEGKAFDAVAVEAKVRAIIAPFLGSGAG